MKGLVNGKANSDLLHKEKIFFYLGMGFMVARGRYHCIHSPLLLPSLLTPTPLFPLPPSPLFPA